MRFLAYGLAAVAARLEPKDAAPAAAALSQAMAKTTDRIAPSYWALRLAAVLTRVDPAELSPGVAAVVAAIGPLPSSGHPAALPAILGRAVEPLACRFSTPELVELLKHPTCVGPARRMILDHLEYRYHQKFTDHWDFVAWAKKHLPGLDLTSPPKRLVK
jgi:hypothetical protein